MRNRNTTAILCLIGAALSPLVFACISLLIPQVRVLQTALMACCCITVFTLLGIGITRFT